MPMRIHVTQKRSVVAENAIFARGEMGGGRCADAILAFAP
jgi:hypothetical protein